MSFRKLLYSFTASSSSSSAFYPLSEYSYRYCISAQRNHGPRLYFSTASSPLPVEPLEDSLFSRLLRVSNTNDSVVPVLNKWVSDGRRVDHYHIQKIIKQFRNYKRFADALEISEWMNYTRHFNVTSGDAAVRLDLIAKVHGLDQAEKFFNNIPDESKTMQIYGSLLNCYADAKALDKAEAVMEKMIRLGFARTITYNVMLSLYCKMGDHDKFNFLVQEMEVKGISYDQFTNSIRLSAYSAASDMVGMEKLLMKMEIDPLVSVDWTAYSIVADGYLKIGAFGKAKMVLNKCEQVIRGRSTSLAYRVLITLYARLGRKDDIYRIWSKHKSSGKFHNTSYIAVISSLAKLDDFDGAEKMLEEWQGKMKFFDSRVPHVLVSAYCRRGHVEKAESLISKLIEGGNEPRASTWFCLAQGYSNSNQIEKAVDMLEKAITISNQSWEPDFPILAQCLEYLDSKGDADRAKTIIGLLEERGKFSVEFRDRLVRHIRKEKRSSEEFDEMEEEAETLEAEDIFGDIPLQS